MNCAAAYQHADQATGADGAATCRDTHRAIATCCRRTSDTLLPVLDVPDKKLSVPLTPLVAKLAVRIVIMPLEVDEPSPGRTNAQKQ